MLGSLCNPRGTAPLPSSTASCTCWWLRDGLLASPRETILGLFIVRSGLLPLPCWRRGSHARGFLEPLFFVAFGMVCSCQLCFSHCVFILNNSVLSIAIKNCIYFFFSLTVTPPLRNKRGGSWGHPESAHAATALTTRLHLGQKSVHLLSLHIFMVYPCLGRVSHLRATLSSLL